MSKQQAQVACAVTHMHFPSHVMVVNANPDASPMAADAPSKTCVDFVCSCIAYSAFAVPHPRWLYGRHRQFVRMLHGLPATVTHIPSLQLMRACTHFVAKRGTDADAKRLLLAVYRQAVQKSGLPWAALAVDVTLLLRAFPDVARTVGVDVVQHIIATLQKAPAGLVLLAAKVADAVQLPCPALDSAAAPLVRAMHACGLPITTFSSTLWRLGFLVAQRPAKQVYSCKQWWAALEGNASRKQLVAALLLRSKLFPVLLQVMPYGDAIAMSATWAWVMPRLEAHQVAGPDGLCALPEKMGTTVLVWRPPQASCVTGDQDCCVCYEPLADPLLPCASFRCGHTMHCACMYDWAVSQEPRVVTCPMCRTPAHEFQELQELDDEVLSEASF